MCWEKKKKKKKISPLSQWNSQAVSFTAKIAQRSKKAHITSWLVAVPCNTHSSGFTEGFSFLDHLFIFPVKKTTDYQQKKKVEDKPLFITSQMLILFLMWCKSYPPEVNVTKISLFTALKTCTISELFLFEQLQVYNSRDLNFIILEDRFVPFRGVLGWRAVGRRKK